MKEAAMRRDYDDEMSFWADQQAP